VRVLSYVGYGTGLSRCQPDAGPARRVDIRAATRFAVPIVEAVTARSYVAGADGPGTERMRRGLHALARLADFLGVGSSTVQGFGATRLLATAP